MSWAWPKMRRWYGILLAILNIPLRIVLWKILYWVSWLEYICWKVLATSLTLREPGMVGGMHLNYSSFYILVSQFFVIKSIKFSTFNTILLWKPWLIRFQILIINFQTICYLPIKCVSVSVTPHYREPSNIYYSNLTFIAIDTLSFPIHT